MVSTHPKNVSQIGSFPQVGVKIKNLRNHHLDFFVYENQRAFDVWPKQPPTLPARSVRQFYGKSNSQTNSKNLWQICPIPQTSIWKMSFLRKTTKKYATSLTPPHQKMACPYENKFYQKKQMPKPTCVLVFVCFSTTFPEHLVLHRTPVARRMMASMLPKCIEHCICFFWHLYIACKL